MRAGFLFKKLSLSLIIIAFVTVGAVALVFRYYAVKVALDVEFHFLVSEEKSVEAGAEIMKLEGGAGYILRYKDKEYAVLSVYLSQEDACLCKKFYLYKTNEHIYFVCLQKRFVSVEKDCAKK
jgi:hypothetical protein